MFDSRAPARRVAVGRRGQEAGPVLSWGLGHLRKCSDVSAAQSSTSHLSAPGNGVSGGGELPGANQPASRQYLAALQGSSSDPLRAGRVDINPILQMSRLRLRDCMRPHTVDVRRGTGPAGSTSQRGARAGRGSGVLGSAHSAHPSSPSQGKPAAARASFGSGVRTQSRNSGWTSLPGIPRTVTPHDPGRLEAPHLLDVASKMHHVRQSLLLPGLILSFPPALLLLSAGPLLLVSGREGVD